MARPPRSGGAVLLLAGVLLLPSKPADSPAGAMGGYVDHTLTDTPFAATEVRQPIPQFLRLVKWLREHPHRIGTASGQPFYEGKDRQGIESILGPRVLKHQDCKWHLTLARHREWTQWTAGRN